MSTKNQAIARKRKKWLRTLPIGALLKQICIQEHSFHILRQLRAWNLMGLLKIEDTPFLRQLRACNLIPKRNSG